MRDLSPHDRPREKLARLGATALGDNELLAVVLGHGGAAQSAMQLANTVLTAVDGLFGLTRASQDELLRVTGLGPARVSQIVAALELGRRTLLTRSPDRIRFASPREVASFLLPQFGSRSVEHCGVVLLDPRQGLIRTTLLSIGTVDSSLVHPRDVFREAVLGGAAAVVLFHNHPTGDPTPSHADTSLTDRLAAAAALMGIELADHIILADSRYYSFREMGGIDASRR